MRDYYGQRACAGLILTEATSVTPQGVGYADTPGIWSDEQVEGWRKVTDAVHAAGGSIFLAALACRPRLGPDLPQWRSAGSAQRCRRRRAMSASSARSAPL